MRELGVWVICMKRKVSQEYVDAVFLRYLQKNVAPARYAEIETKLNVDPIVRANVEDILDWWKDSRIKRRSKQ